jgi:hypothetical protein
VAPQPRFIGRTGYGFDLSLEVLGDQVVSEEYERTADRIEDLSPAWRRVMDDFELSEKALFASFTDPKYVRSGRLMKSLTGTSPDSIREVHNQQAVFGSRVFYARFQRSPRRYNASTKGRSAVLKLNAPLKKVAAKRLLHFVVHGEVPV